jgi:tetraacyldisaccharide-1-P 4'-kinase
LLTTEKDYVRLDTKWQSTVKPLGISVTWDDETLLTALLEPVMSFAR